MSGELRLDGNGLLFLDGEVEGQFANWRKRVLESRLRVVIRVSLWCWVCLLLISYLLGDLEAVSPGSKWIFIFTIPYLTAAMFMPSGSRGFRRMNASSSIVFGMLWTGCITIFWFGLYVWKSWHLAMFFSMLFFIWILYLRLPHKTSMWLLAVYAIPLVVASGYELSSGRISAFEAAIWLTTLVSALMEVVSAVRAEERMLRRMFCEERQNLDHRVQLEKGRDLIRRYVPATVSEQLLSGNSAAVEQPSRRRVTVLFSDVVGFTAMSDRVEPEDVTQVLNEYMAEMSEIVQNHGGTLNEFAGDGLMAMFGAPKEMKPREQAQMAVKAALSMQKRMPELNLHWKELGVGEDLRIRIGINTGMNSVGSFGSKGRMTYTAIGQQTNIAARIEANAEPGAILISDSTYQLVCESMVCEPKGEIEVKGVHYPIKVYAVKATA